MDGLRGTIASSLGSPNGPPPLTPISQARQCQLCLVTLANANLLRRHVEDHHFHIRKYDCVHCGKKFKRKEHRERHERIHTGEKPFVCHICNARFTQKEHLKGHVENVHHKHGEKGMDDLDPLEDREDRDDEEMDIPPHAPRPLLPHRPHHPPSHLCLPLSPWHRVPPRLPQFSQPHRWSHPLGCPPRHPWPMIST
ncbi:hypothetical protein C7M84_002249 [Penaeus vannamei]|uniref:C2H2-type domain-containing protein n=1 Tax=Penaeus vannamei TaxID=6689 RepID=A0A423TRI5_PENVA|nr:hypothetical protein C7M84_002249 [Penaeus vannamei]